MSETAAWKDAVEEACENGIGTIAQPGGSMRDKDAVLKVIAGLPSVCPPWKLADIFAIRRTQVVLSPARNNSIDRGEIVLLCCITLLSQQRVGSN